MDGAAQPFLSLLWHRPRANVNHRLVNVASRGLQGTPPSQTLGGVITPKRGKVPGRAPAP
eukprot:7752147-Pyramimonas_sp.AAC.1